MAISEIAVKELVALGDGIRLIDVREHDEWADGHVPYATHVPLRTVPEHLEAFDGDPTYVLCKVGGRSYQACAFASEHGKNVVNVVGGMVAWCGDGHETVTGS